LMVAIESQQSTPTRPVGSPKTRIRSPTFMPGRNRGPGNVCDAGEPRARLRNGIRAIAAVWSSPQCKRVEFARRAKIFCYVAAAKRRMSAALCSSGFSAKSAKSAANTSQPSRQSGSSAEQAPLKGSRRLLFELRISRISRKLRKRTCERAWLDRRPVPSTTSPASIRID
jgi:hypothetical protein